MGSPRPSHLRIRDRLALQRSATLGDDGPIGLVMVPTRELAIQVSTPSGGYSVSTRGSPNVALSIGLVMVPTRELAIWVSTPSRGYSVSTQDSTQVSLSIGLGMLPTRKPSIWVGYSSCTRGVLQGVLQGVL